VPDPDDTPIEFYQKFCDIVSPDLLTIFNKLYHGRLDIARLNYGILSLWPKCKGVDKFEAYRSVCLLTVIYEIF
jgi:hypothetical protein